MIPLSASNRRQSDTKVLHIYVYYYEKVFSAFSPGFFHSDTDITTHCIPSHCALPQFRVSYAVDEANAMCSEVCINSLKYLFFTYLFIPRLSANYVKIFSIAIPVSRHIVSR